MPDTYRHRLARAALRRLFLPLARPETPLALQRRMLDAAALLVRKPRGLQANGTTLDGIPARKLTPRGSTQRHLLYLHGGAYIAGSLLSHTALAGQVTAAARATAWLIDYRLAPEHPYPAAEQDALRAYRALLAQGIPAANIVVAGDSAGGGLTLATTLAMRDAGLPLPAALVLLSPWTDLTLSGRSIAGKRDVEPMLREEWLDRAAGAYCGAENADENVPTVLRTEPGVSPVFADFRGFPPMLLQVGSDEILLDDSTFLAQRARAAGVAVELNVYKGLWHVFQAQAGVIPEADAALAEIGRFIDHHLGG